MKLKPLLGRVTVKPFEPIPSGLICLIPCKLMVAKRVTHMNVGSRALARRVERCCSGKRWCSGFSL
ncbi:10 kDa chaperonin [Candidatus Hodgkinia cicadicola]|nr:10 kDa chaperonin [Candidatus Hodgkinia cicadicola]